MKNAIRILMLALLATPSILPAQTTRDTTRLHDLVVTATRAPTNAHATAAATTVIRGDELRARGITFVSDALREVPGMMLVQTGSYGAVSALFLRGGEGDYVKFLLDGVTLNQPGGGFNLASLTTDDLDRIEIVRGPSSVLYGSDAMSGVVQLFTRSGSGKLHGDVAARGGSYGSRDVQGHLATAIGKSSLSAGGSSFRSDGLYDFNSGYRNNVGSLRLGLDGGKQGGGAFTVRYGDAEGHYPTDGNGVPVDHNQYTIDKSTALGLELHRDLSARVMATVQGFASRLNSNAVNRPDSPADSVGFGFDADRTGVTWRKGVDARADIRSVGNSLVSIGAGVEYESENQRSHTVSNFGTGGFATDDAFAADRTTRNIFAQVLAEPVRSVTLQLGSRIDDNSAFGTFGTWRVGASWQLAHATRLFGSAGTAFKAPTFSELFAASAFEVGNRDLLPERSRSVEAGLEQRFAEGRFTLGVTAFSQQFHDLIQYVGAAPGDPTYRNLGGARARGVEASASLRASGSLMLRAHWTWLRTEVTDTGAASSVVFEQGQRLLRRPASSGGVNATWRVRGATLSAGASYVGARDDADFRDFPATRTTLPSYALVDLSLDAPIRRANGTLPGLDLTLRGENIFDANWVQVVGYPGRGRTLFGGARLHF
ncbi:MAG: TonB-dependent receptor [Gemmatimonadales bacterium]